VKRTLDKDGAITLTQPTNEIKFRFESLLAEVNYGYTSNFDYIRDSVIFAITEGENVLLLDENNSNQYVRYAIHHINVAKQSLLEIDPALTCMDVVLSIRLAE